MSQYSVFVNHSPEKVLANDSIEAYFDGSIRGLLLGSDNPALKYTKQTRVAGLPAMEYQYAHIIDGVPVITRGIIVMVDGNHMRLSQIYTEDDLGADKNFNRFISSFRLVPIDELLSNHRYENVPRGIAFSPPVGWQQEATKYPQIPVLFFSPFGHMVQIIDSGLSSYTCNNFKQEIQTTQGIQASGSINVRRRAVIWVKSTAHNPSAKIRTTTIHYCLNTSRGAVILQGMAPEATFVRSETIFRKVADSLVVRQ